MDEAYTLCDEIIIIDKGVIVSEGKPRDLLLHYFKGTRLILPLNYKEKCLNLKYDWIEKDHYIEVKTSHIQELIKELSSKGIPIDEMEVRPYRLDDLFLHLTGESLKADFDKYI